MSSSDLGGRIRDLLLGGQGSRTVVLALLLILLAGLLVASLIFVLYSRSPRGRLASLTQDRATATAAGGGGWLVQILAVTLLIVGFAAGNASLERPSTCAQCHTDELVFASVAETEHADLECADCHRPRGAVWPARQVMTFARWTYVNAANGNKEPEPRPGSVTSSRCLDCHDEITERTVARGGIKVRHADFVEQLYGCRDCHNVSSHPGALAEPTEPTMEKCLPCHDGVTASSECETCHAEDVGRPSRPDAPLPKVELTEAGQYASCYVCHQEDACNSCHGIRMPHPEEWATRHMRDGFTRRDLCWRCHYSGDQIFVPSSESCSCHGLPGTMHGGELWIREHGLQATGQKAGENAECFLCHGGALCGYCHDESYAGRYNPLPAGYDTYRPSPSAQPPADGGIQPLWP
ncbi:MAG: multiheme c-type cytochrome [Thermoleophilia bacterium]